MPAHAPTLRALYRLLVVIWVGSLLTIGFLVAPTLFSLLPPAQAGALAARLFHVEAVLGLVCGAVMWWLQHRLAQAGLRHGGYLRWLVPAMLACTLLGYFALQPFMNAWRLAALQSGTDVGHSVYAARFGILHGVSTVFFVIQSVLGLLLAWRLPRLINVNQ